MGIKEKFQNTESSFKRRLSYIKSDAGFIKEVLEAKDPIFLKTEAIAILVKRKGESKIFFESLDKITQEGYELKSQETITDPIPKLNVALAEMFYFQNKKFVK
jgi:hypothetical protein